MKVVATFVGTNKKDLFKLIDKFAKEFKIKDNETLYSGNSVCRFDTIKDKGLDTCC